MRMRVCRVCRASTHTRPAPAPPYKEQKGLSDNFDMQQKKKNDKVCDLTVTRQRAQHSHVSEEQNKNQRTHTVYMQLHKGFRTYGNMFVYVSVCMCESMCGCGLSLVCVCVCVCVCECATT